MADPDTLEAARRRVQNSMARVIAVSPNKKMGAKLIYKVAKQESERQKDHGEKDRKRQRRRSRSNARSQTMDTQTTTDDDLKGEEDEAELDAAYNPRQQGPTAHVASLLEARQSDRDEVEGQSDEEDKAERQSDDEDEAEGQYDDEDEAEGQYDDEDEAEGQYDDEDEAEGQLMPTRQLTDDEEEAEGQSDENEEEELSQLMPTWQPMVAPLPTVKTNPCDDPFDLDDVEPESRSGGLIRSGRKKGAKA